MPLTIKINNLTLVHRRSGGVSRATLPDVCKTPPAMVPIPYPNTTFSRDLERGTRTVAADSGSMIAVSGSIFTPSTGDEPGAGGGVVSGVNRQESRWLTYSIDVTIEGRNACRLTDKKIHNRGNTVDAAGLNQSNMDDKAICDWEKRDGAVIGVSDTDCGCEPYDRDKVRPITPRDCQNAASLRKIVFVNGILNSGKKHCDNLHKIAKHRCAAVTGVYNRSDNFFKDLSQSIGDKLGIGNNPAVDTLQEMITESVQAGQPFEIIGHSQGAIITSRALGDARNRAAVDATAPDWSLVSVTTFGGAAWTFPDGISVTHLVNVIDPVPLLFGATGFAEGALVGGLVSGLPGAALGGVGGMLANSKDMSAFFKLSGNPHKFDIYLDKLDRGPCLCMGE
jgi:hypothetical protein